MIYISYSDDYVINLPEGHRFPMEKYELIPSQLLYEKSYELENFFAPGLVESRRLERVHDPAYINKVEQGRLHSKEQRRIGFPWSEELVRREKIIVQGSIEGALRAKEYGVSFNAAGGTHHAYPGHGEGFCIFNDIAVAAQFLLDEGLVSQILVVDLDVHQGNGTAAIFRNTPQVFTFSMHGAKNYPLRKENSDLDLPLEDHTKDSEYLAVSKKHLPELLNRLKPDFVFYQAGVDALNHDRLGKLDLSIQGLKERDRFVFESLQAAGVPVQVSMGGGYATRLRDIVESHCNTYRIAAEIY